MSTVAMTALSLELHGIRKSFGHVVALRDVSLKARAGEVLAIVGDNGAGKSTLVKIVSGVYHPDAGEIAVEGETVELDTPADARRTGIATVFQDLALVEVLDVATNMFIGQLPRRGLFVDRKKMEAEARTFLDSLGVTVSSVRTRVGMLSGGQRQIVAIARAMGTGSKIVVLDEPTAALGVRETAQAAQLISKLRDDGCAVVCVSHDLEFVFEFCDRIQVMRLGRVAAVRETRRTTREEIVGLITGSISPDAAEDHA
jgi:ABC-type sugar transport system ATPase subunit